ncbi:hypothetical protein NFJ02_25g58560 [Pycnococcus provasolii]
MNLANELNVPQTCLDFSSKPLRIANAKRIQAANKEQPTMPLMPLVDVLLLDTARANGDAACVAAALAAGANVDVVGEDGISAIGHAARHGDGKAVAELLSSGMTRDSDAGARTGCARWRCGDALRAAAANARADVARMLLNAATDDLHRAVDDEGRNALHVAMRTAARARGNADVRRKAHAIAKMVLRFAARVNDPEYVDIPEESDENFTALHIASAAGDAEGVKFLLELGAIPAITDANGRLPRHVALNSAVLEQLPVLSNDAETLVDGTKFGKDDGARVGIIHTYYTPAPKRREGQSTWTWWSITPALLAFVLLAWSIRALVNTSAVSKS